MILRGLGWLMAVGALAVALASEWGPFDPPRRSEPAHADPASAVVVYSWADRDPLVGKFELVEAALDSSGLLDSELYYAAPGQVRPAPWLAAYGATPPRTQSLLASLEALSRAAVQDLDAPVPPTSDLNFRTLGSGPPEGGAGFRPVIWPLGTAGAAERLEGRSEFGLYGYSVRLWGAILATCNQAEVQVHRDLVLWRAARGSAPWLASTGAPPTAPEELCVEFHATQALNPDADFTQDLWIAWTLGRYLGENLQGEYALGGGFYCRLRSEQHAQIRQILRDPGLIRLARNVIAAPHARRAAARRDALLGDDPLPADFAADTLKYRDRVDPAELPEELVTAWPPRTRTTPGQAIDALPVWTVLARFDAAERARRLRRLLACAADVDVMAKVIAEAFLDDAPEVRAVAGEVFLERLPRGALEENQVRFRLSLSIDVRSFLDALTDRLWAELKQGDAERACDLVSPALGVNARGLPPAPSQLVEMAAHLLFDPVHGERFREGANDHTLSLAAEECLRNSDPAVRRAAWQVLRTIDKKWGQAPFQDTGDPYLEDLVAGDQKQ